MKGDLHCHSKLSDGSQGIEDIIAMSKKMNLNFVAITDHDTMSSHSRAKIVGIVTGCRLFRLLSFLLLIISGAEGYIFFVICR